MEQKPLILEELETCFSVDRAPPITPLSHPHRLLSHPLLSNAGAPLLRSGCWNPGWVSFPASLSWVLLPSPNPPSLLYSEEL